MEKIIIVVVLLYFITMGVIAKIAGGKGNGSTFYSGNRNSKWYIVAIGMISASISGISVISVPGMVRNIGWTYLQMVIGFFFGYVAIVYVLLPLYYKLKLTSIYGYLGQRFGKSAHQTAAGYFILFKMVAAASRLYVVIIVLQYYLLDRWNIPFLVTASFFVLFIFTYTYRTGIKALVWTDCFQTICMIGAIVLLIASVCGQLHGSMGDILQQMWDRPESKIFVFDDFYSRQNFFKQFISGIFVVIVMTGLDQDVMQKNLTCKNLKEARKDMLSYGICFLPVNFLFLALGLLLILFSEQNGIALPETNDTILPYFAMNYFGGTIAVLFIIALLSAAFSSADSALVSLTTSISIDLLHKDAKEINEKQRIKLHLLICIAFIGVMELFRIINSQSAIDAIYTLVGYLYGPMLGLFSFGLFTHYALKNKWVPLVCIASPLISYLSSYVCNQYLNYQFGYELLLLNGGITFLCLWLIREGKVSVPPTWN